MASVRMTKETQGLTVKEFYIVSCIFLQCIFRCKRGLGGAIHECGHSQTLNVVIMLSDSSG